MPKKKKLLPKNFEELLKKGALGELKAIFASCELDARGGYGKQTALAYRECPAELARWLVEQGADLEATDTWGNTPLHAKAGSVIDSADLLLELGANVHNDSSSVGTPLHAAARVKSVDNARSLLKYGAKVDAKNKDGLTPLELALKTCDNIQIERMVPLAECLFDAGAARTDRMKDFVSAIGAQFEYCRVNFNPDSVDAVSAALTKLYELFDVPPAPRRILHDGKSRIVIRASTWQDQHEELWNLLVPSSGAAATAQGEVVRIVGRISHELEGNGGVNWDADFKKMADAFVEILQQGNALTANEIAEAKVLSAEAKRKCCNPERMAKLAIRWIQLNPAPINLQTPAYRR